MKTFKEILNESDLKDNGFAEVVVVVDKIKKESGGRGNTIYFKYNDPEKNKKGTPKFTGSRDNFIET